MTTTTEQIRMLAEEQMKDPSLELLQDCDGAKLKVLLLEDDSMVCRYWLTHAKEWSPPRDRAYSETMPENGPTPVTVTDSGREWLRINGGDWIEAGGDAVKVRLRYDAKRDRTEMQCVSIDDRLRGSPEAERKFLATNGWRVNSVSFQELFVGISKELYVCGCSKDKDSRTGQATRNHVAAIAQAVNEANAAWEKELVTVPCCVCGKPVDTKECDEGGDNDGSQLSDGRWTCSHECWDKAAGPLNGPIVTALHEMRDRLDALERMIVGGGE